MQTPCLNCKAFPCSATSLLTLNTMHIASTGLCSQSFFCSFRPRASCSVYRHARSNEAVSDRGVDFATRRALLSLAAAVLATPALAAVSTSPYEDAKSMSYGLDEERRIRSCPGAVNPNCISTRSLSQMYSPAWRASEPDPRTATKLFENALKRVCPDAQVVKQAQMPNADFRAFSVAGLYGQDIIEILVRTDSSADTSKQSSDLEGPLLTFRSMAANVKYIWPLQAPLSDAGAQRKRLNAVRQQLGWQVIGCDYIECFQ